MITRKLISPTLMSWVLVVLAATTLSGCFRSQLLTFTLDAPPQVLVPTKSAAVLDARPRFRQIWCAVREDHGRPLPEDRPCDEVLLRVGSEASPIHPPVVLGPPRHNLRVAVVPGLYGECFRSLGTPFSDGLAHLRTHGYQTDLIMVSGRSSSRHNSSQIRDAVLAMNLASDERLLLVGHSKGAVDILEALTRYPEIVPHVAAVVSVAGAINGSPLVDGLRSLYASVLQGLSLADCDEGDGGAFASLRRDERIRFLADVTLPQNVRYFSVVGIVDPDHTSRVLRPGARRLATLDPRNDGQVLWTDAIIPGATLLGYVQADHWAIALPFSRTSPALAATLIDHNAFPREVLLETIVRTVDELLADPDAQKPR